MSTELEAKRRIAAELHALISQQRATVERKRGVLVEAECTFERHLKMLTYLKEHQLVVREQVQALEISEAESTTQETPRHV